MDKFKKKIKSKIFHCKSTATDPKTRRYPKLWHSASIPFRSSCDTSEESHDDYSEASYNPPSTDRYSDCPSAHDPNDFTRPYKLRSHAHKILLDQFPKPPSSIPQQPAVTHQIPLTLFNPLLLAPVVPVTPKRPARPLTQDFSDVPTEHLLPNFPPEIKAKIQALDAEHARRQREKYNESARAARKAAILRSQAIQRSALNISKYNTPPLSIRRRDPSKPTAAPVPVAGIYKNSSASQSMCALDSDSRTRCASTRADATAGAGSGTHRGSSPTSSISTNPRMPSRNLSQNTCHDADLEPSNSIDVIPLVDGSASSSRSVRAMRRHGLMPSPSDTADEKVQHPEMFRILRGPHAAKFQVSAPHMKAHEISLLVNDMNSGKEWGANYSKVGGAATVAGYERGAYAQRR
ncbi:hypothetical protein C0991_011170 [Blastosporella zonata]|nr:hypothetical protein C0991_011170 [Blastosporella zonata]